MKTRNSSKKAASHLEMIISFSIFLLFVIFLFTFMSPVKQPDVSESLIKVVEKGISEYESSLVEVPVATKTAQTGCFKITSPFASTQQANIFIKDRDGNDVGFAVSGQTITISGNGNDFYYLYYSDDAFTHLKQACSAESSALDIMPQTDYTFSVPRTKDMYFLSKLLEIKSRYETEEGYKQLKQEFNYPDASDFAIFVPREYSDTIILSMDRQKPEKVPVFAREMAIIVLKEDESGNGNKEEIPSMMNIQVW